MLTFDFLIGIERLGTRIQPRIRSRHPTKADGSRWKHLSRIKRPRQSRSSDDYGKVAGC